MAAYSVLAWVQAALTLYLWFMVLAALRRKEREPDILTRTLRAELGWFARWPVWLSPLPVIVLSGLLWLAIAGPLARTGLLPPFASSRHVWQQALVVGVAVLGSLKWPLTAACLLRFLLDRVYVGASPLWEYAHGIGGTVSSWPRRLPLRFGALDFSSLAAGAGWWAAGWFLDGLAARVFQRLPL
jgi:hypothetical protein